MRVKEVSRKWGLSDERITKLCRDGKIQGAKKNGKSWLIPIEAEKPKDGRYKDSNLITQNNKVKLPLPIGISDYKSASTEYYYVDKTLMIKDFLDERPKVSLYTRPRRFGKTLNMDMLKTYFEKTDEDTSIYFKDKQIWQCGEQYHKYQGKYPVIFLTFKDVKFNTWLETFEKIRALIREEFSRHEEIAVSEQCHSIDKEYYNGVLYNEVSENVLTGALAILSKMLHQYYKIAPIIIIDEYDIPIQQGYSCGFYDEVILFMRNLFSGGLKDNQNLSFGFLTGVLRVAKESIFSGLNNLKINSILDNKYSEYFGFTKDEVKRMANYYGVVDKYEEICNWYNGYRFGSTEIFNPWSVINYFSNDCKPRAFWQSTGSNDIIGEILEDASEDIYERLEKLLKGETFFTFIDTGVIYPQIKSNPLTIYSFLLVAGYLKAEKIEPSTIGDFRCEVSVPNKEITAVYNKEILQRLHRLIPQSTAIAIQEALYSNNVDELQKQIHKLLLQSVSSFDTLGENFYHGLILGLCTILDDKYFLTSNRESGEGRYDIQLMPKDFNMPGILIELKYRKDCTQDELEELSRTALKQIEKKKYDTDMRSRNVQSVLKYGVAFSGKNVEISLM